MYPFIYDTHIHTRAHIQSNKKINWVWNDMTVNEQMMTAFSLLDELFL